MGSLIGIWPNRPCDWSVSAVVRFLLTPVLVDVPVGTGSIETLLWLAMFVAVVFSRLSLDLLIMS